MTAVPICSDFGAPKIKSDTVYTVSPSISHEVMELDAMIFIFWMLSFKPTFHSPLSLSSRGFLVPLHFLFWYEEPKPPHFVKEDSILEFWGKSLWKSPDITPPPASHSDPRSGSPDFMFRTYDLPRKFELSPGNGNQWEPVASPGNENQSEPNT